MPRTLYARLAAVLVALFVVIGIVYAVISGALIQRYLLELTQHFNRDLAQRILEDGKLVVGGRLDGQALKKTLGAYMDINPSIEIYLLDQDGLILAYSAEPDRVKRTRVDLAPVKAFLDGAGFPLLGDDPRSHDRRKAFSATPLPLQQGTGGYLYVVLRGEQYDTAEQAVQESYVLRLSAVAVAGSLGFGLLAGLLLFHRLTRRLQRLSNRMGDFQASGFSRYLPYAARTGARTGDEIERLGYAFDGMARRIVSLITQLRDQDRLRRELVAQVSHDLRTPLAALHGYLETLRMKRDELDRQTRDEYLEVALRQSGNLKRRVEDLFELAHLEARDTHPRYEDFPLADLLQDVAQKFRLRAEQAEVALDVRPPAASPLVRADIALVERLLDNLIGNALDHTPAGGRVTLTMGLAGRSLVVAVADTGPGISPEDLPRVFEPFYRGQPGAVRKGHAGLGLTIAKRIADLHAGRLTAANGPDGGAAFTFTLPLAQAGSGPHPQETDS